MWVDVFILFSPFPPQDVIFVKIHRTSQALLVAQLLKKSTFPAGDLGSIPGLGRSRGEENSYPFQYSGLENSMHCIVHGVAKSWTRLSNFHFTSLTCKEVRQLVYIYLKSMTLFEEAKRKKKPDNDNFPAFSLSFSSNQIYFPSLLHIFYLVYFQMLRRFFKTLLI